ncbi:MAG: hypothetical protein H6747_14090 [Deltaproteobacteria bacterium]|nr:hypothetical protein [Deltaproteobacteria bacterium]
MRNNGFFEWRVATRTVATLALALAVAGCGGEVGSSGTAADATSGGSDGTVGDDGTGAADGAAGSDTAASDSAGTDATAADTGGSQCGAPTGQRPSRRSEHVAVFDPKHNKLVSFGGSFGVPENCGFPTPTFESETWIYDPVCDSWTESKATGPSGRVRAAAVWVESLGKVVVMGGRRRNGPSGNYTLLNDAWAYDVGADSWTQLSDGAGITPRFNHTMVYAAERNELLVFAGNLSPSGLQYTANADVYAYSFANGTWSKLTTSGTGPNKRFFAGGVWDPKRKRMVIYGGADESLFNQNAKYMSDLWALDFQSDPPAWSKIDGSASTKPDARFWGELAYDGKTDRYVLFGGHDDAAQGNRNDLWGFDASAGDWGTLRYGDIWNKPANGFCSFPPDFTKVDEDAPERRSGGAVAAAPGGIWVMAGKTDCGIIDDLFYFDYAKGAWEERTTATVGEACLRKGGLSCNDYCF